jgi:hypothetical protein
MEIIGKGSECGRDPAGAFLPREAFRMAPERSGLSTLAVAD